MIKPLEDLLPLMGVEHDCILSRRGDVTLAYEVQLPEIFTLSAEEYEALHQAWVKAIRVLPRHSIVHKQDWYSESGYRANFGREEESFLSRSSERFFHERPYLDHVCYLHLTRLPAARRPSTSALSSLLRPGLVPAQTLDRLFLEEFLSQAGQFVRLLEDCGLVRLTQLKETDLCGDSRSQGLIERYCYLVAKGAPPIVRDLSFRDGIRIGDLHAKLYALSEPGDLPGLCGSRITYERYSTDHSKCSIGFTASLGQLLPCNHIYSQFIFIEDADKTVRKLEGKRRRLQSLAAYSRSNAIARDGTNAFLEEAVSEQRLPVKAHFHVLAWAEEKADLGRLRNLITTALARIDARPREEVLGAPQIFWAGIPGNEGDFPMNDTFDTFAEQAACFLNAETNYRSSLSPVGLRLGDRISGVPVHVDLSDEPVRMGICSNRNKFILGPSGSGKSFFTNHMVRCYYEQGAHVVLVDVGHSYAGLCRLLGGYYFTYDEQHPIRFNPFWRGAGESFDTERKESLKTLLLALWKKDSEPFRRSEYVALSNALQQFLDAMRERPTVFPCFDSFFEFLRDEFTEVLRRDGVRDRDFDVGNFLYVLRPYYKGGEYDFLLNATENLDLMDQRFIVFELDNIKDHPILFPVVTIIIMEVFISKMRQLKGVRKMILIEEAWKAIAKEGMAEYIKYLFKTVRKFYGEAVVVTQEVEDIIASPIVKQAIINNSDCKILLDQSKYLNKFEQVQELLGLTDKEKALALSVNKANDPNLRYKEVFISLGGQVSKVYRTEVSPEEYYTYTTEEKEKTLVLEYARRYGDMQKGIKALVQTLILLLFLWTPGVSKAQILVAQVIQEGIKKVIVAVDLEVQRLQTATIQLQETQKEVENALSQSELGQIGSWVQQQRDLYSEYYTELEQVKSAIAGFERVREVIDKATQTVQAYHQAYELLHQDPHFSASELTYLNSEYGAMVGESAQDLDQFYLLLTDFSTQMTDGQRLKLIDATADGIDKVYQALQHFTNQNVLLSLQRARSTEDYAAIKNLYGVP